jgi:hypothetical protein
MKNFRDPKDALWEATRARKAGDMDSEAFYLGYASGLTEAQRGAKRDDTSCK